MASPAITPAPTAVPTNTSILTDRSSSTKTTASDIPPISPGSSSKGGVNLAAIGFTCAGGFVVSALALFCFGIAVRLRAASGIAPRCSARHPNTVYNVEAGREKRRDRRRAASRKAQEQKQNGGCCRRLGNCLFGWLCESLSRGLFRRRRSPPTSGKEREAKVARAEARAGLHASDLGKLGKGGVVDKDGLSPTRSRWNRLIGGGGAGASPRSLDGSVDTKRRSNAANGTSSRGGGGAHRGGNSGGSGQTAAGSSSGEGHLGPPLDPMNGAVNGGGGRPLVLSDITTSGNGFANEEDLLGRGDMDDEEDDDDDDDDDEYRANKDDSDVDATVQYRGNPFTGWIPWTLSLPYDTMLRGVPGTGTRKRGLEGNLLKVNMDAIVLLRFHAICLRVAVVATILCIGIVLPLNLTARCHNVGNDPTHPSYDPQCFGKDYQLTDYERTTLKNIPPLTYADADEGLLINYANDTIYYSASSNSGSDGFLARIGKAFRHSATNTIWGSTYRRNLGRLYGIVLCSWIITWYAVRCIGREWIDALALRRVYYLENGHWEDRKEELGRTLLRDDEDDASSEDDDDGGDGDEEGGEGAVRRRRAANRTAGGGEGAGAAKDGSKKRAKQKKKKKRRKRNNNNTKRREPWIPHPEQRDTVPNVELYSVLVGGLPALPSEVVDEQDIEAAVGFSRRQSIDWQLAVATSFFDHCVPNQPGFSSSIAAVTILPDAPDLARSWRKWYVAAAALRRLRFIRTLIADLRHYDFDDFGDDDDSEDASTGRNTVRESIEMKLTQPPPVESHPSRGGYRHQGGGGGNIGAVEDLDNKVGVDISYQTALASDAANFGLFKKTKNGSIEMPGLDDPEEDAKAIYLDTQRRMKYYRDVFGSSENEDVEAHLFQALNYGPEQSAVYSREMAQGAAACCPNGCGEERLRRAGIDELLVLERDAIAAVHHANLNLQYAQARAAVSVLDTEDPKMHLPQKGHREDMEKHLEEDRRFVPLHSNFTPNDEMADSLSANIPGAPLGRNSDLSGASPGLPSGIKKSHHKQSSSFDDLSLPEALQMEAQLLTKFNRSSSGKHFNNSHLRQSSSEEGNIVTPTITNRKVGVGSADHVHEEGVECGIGLPSLGLPTISEGQGSRQSQQSSDPHAAYPMTSRVPSHPSAVYVSSDPDHPLLRDPSQGMDLEDDIATGQVIPPTPSSISTQSTKANSKSPYESRRGGQGPNPLLAISNKAMALSSDGKFYLRDASSVAPSPRSSPSVAGSLHSNRGGEARTGNLLNLTPSTPGSESKNRGEWPPPIPGSTVAPGLTRRRLNTDSSGVNNSQRQRTYSGEQSVQWAAVERIISDDTTMRERDASSTRHKPTSGVWKMPTPSSILWSLWGVFAGFGLAIWNWATSKADKVVDDLARESTFAVVTFTSRQAAVAARHCIADGRGQSRWLTVSEIPVPPLSDAAVCDFITCRGCCRPVSLSIPKKQQMLRKYFSYLLLASIYIFYTFPISAAAAFADPTKLYELWPELENIVNSSVIFSEILSGIVPALLFTLFFALCPVMFKAIANFGSNASSVAVCERAALNYYWWFMVCTAFSGSSLMTMVLNAFNEGQIANSVTEVLVEIAGTIPTQVASTWINWIIVRTTMTLPLQYMLQVNTFLFKCIGWKCCARCVVGGGPGGPIPYRIYIDSGVVFLCIVALAPASPLVAPFALLYFLYCSPLWRRNCIYVYRPKFDTGGRRWPFLSEVFIWSMVVGQILLTTMMALKEAVGPAIFAALPIIPTLVFRKMSRHRYFKSYMDAGLLQTSLLDGWDNSVPTSLDKREEFRQFLVDAHKAAYIPVCIAGGAANVLTAEPAVVVQHENDAGMELPPADVQVQYNMDESIHSNWATTPQFQERASAQFGASLRRLTAAGPSVVHEYE